MATILIIEDNEVFGELLLMHLEESGHEPLLAPNLEQGRRLLASTQPDAVLLDQQLPDGFGLELLQEIKALNPSPPVIMITGVTDNTLTIEAMKLGAYDFVRKPMDDVELDKALGNALRTHRLSRKISAITSGDDYQVDVSQIVGESSAILNLCKTIGSVASSNTVVLITGESGTGKEVVARALHHHSGRSGLFLPINCSTIVENLLESELFGHEKGSFTGADSRKEGKFEVASDGTLFLDELGEMPLSLQAKLLRVLQEGTFERVGGTQTLHTSARIIAATNRDLHAMVREGIFREDLYYRLNVVNIHLSPLRERMADLPLLTEHLLKKINRKLHRSVSHIAESAWKCMNGYHWPGNVRELENILTRATVLARGDTITPDLLGIISESEAAVKRESNTGDEVGAELITLEELEQRHVQQILEHTCWHKGRSCEILGISRPALDRKIAKYGLG